MDTYFKYTGFHGIETILNPMLRLSPPCTLNDPFEVLLPENLKLDIIENSKLEDIELDRGLFFSGPFEKTFLSMRLYDAINDYGIVSLSETPRNTLMWSHYAEQHTGICIGLDKNLFSQAEINNTGTWLSIEKFSPVKINYDNIRPQISEDPMPANEKLKRYIYQQMTTKHDAWMYEKEHRCILPMNMADELKVMESSNIKSSITVNALIEANLISVNENGNYYGPSMPSLVTMYGRGKNSIFLKKIEKGSVKSIHLGCKISLADKNDILDAVSTRNYDMTHVKVFQCVPSKDRFEFEIIKL